MSLMKGRMEEHMSEIGEMNELQTGFTASRRKEDNAFILNYSMEESKRRRKELIVMAVDFENAFDSVDRRCVIEALVKYKCDPLFIDVVAILYQDDYTEIYLDNRKMDQVVVTSRIRQGCTLSQLLFIMVINSVIEKLQAGV